MVTSGTLSKYFYFQSDLWFFFKSSEKLKVLKGVYIALHVQNKDYGHLKFWKIFKEFLFLIRLMIFKNLQKNWRFWLPFKSSMSACLSSTSYTYIPSHHTLANFNQTKYRRVNDLKLWSNKGSNSIIGVMIIKRWKQGEVI